MEIEEYMADAVYVMVSKSSYDLLQKYKQQEIAEQNESRLETIKTDNIGVYRRRELLLRGFVFIPHEQNGVYTLNDKGKILSFAESEINGIGDSHFFILMDELEKR